jgi:hypothetical protein
MTVEKLVVYIWEHLQTKSGPGTNLDKPSVADAAIFDLNTGRLKKSCWRDTMVMRYALNCGTPGYPQTNFDTPRNVLLRMIHLFVYFLVKLMGPT